MADPIEPDPSLRRADPFGDDAVLQTVYAELRALAGSMLRSQRPGHTLQPTALVNEAFVRMLSRTALRAEDRTQFKALAACVMRHILVDHARERGAIKRGGGAQRLTIGAAEDRETPAPDGALDVMALDEALVALASLDERKARLVEMRVFAGMSLDEAAEALQVARSTAALDWRFARAWLVEQLAEGEGDSASEPGANP